LIFKSKKDVETAQDLYKSGHYDWVLFMLHIAIEKVLKAKLVSLGKQIIYTHDLTRLAKEAVIFSNQELIEKLNEITTFNIEARYDDYKLSFYKKATKVFTEKWMENGLELYELIKKSI